MTAVPGAPGPVDGSALTDLVRGRLRQIPDHPEPGVVFQDITPLLGDPVAFAAVVEALAAPHRAAGDGSSAVDVVAGIEARGFMFGAPVALALGAAFVPVRKKGKLPFRTVGLAYDLEYGSAEIEIHEDALVPGARVLVVDDVLATGGTAAAACRLLEQVGGRVTEVAVLLELGFLPGREALAGRAVRALVTL